MWRKGSADANSSVFLLKTSRSTHIPSYITETAFSSNSSNKASFKQSHARSLLLPDHSITQDLKSLPSCWGRKPFLIERSMSAHNIWITWTIKETADSTDRSTNLWHLASLTVASIFVAIFLFHSPLTQGGGRQSTTCISWNNTISSVIGCQYSVP